MKKLLGILSILISFFLLTPYSALAQAPTDLPQIEEYSYKINNLEVFTNPEKVSEMYKDPKTRIDGNTHSVWVTFTGLDPAKEYYICGSDSLKLCNKGSSSKVKPNDQGIVVMNVCGAGKNKLKGVEVNSFGSTDQDGAKLGEKCKDGRDYFHEGQTYNLTVYDYFLDGDVQKDIDKGIPFADLSVANIITAEIFVAHSYPIAKISSPNALRDALTVTLWGRRPGDGNDNNYQVVMEGLDHKFKKEQCYQLPGKAWTQGEETVGVNSQFVSTDGKTPNQPQHILDGTGWNITKRADAIGQYKTFGSASDKEIGPLGRGTYILKINERISDNRPLDIRESCSGGHTYMHIFFSVGQSKTAVNGIDILKVVYDPNNSDGKDIDDSAPFPEVPCAGGSFDKATDTCKAFSVALLGKIPLDPLSFIKSVYGLVLSIAGIAALLIIIRAGYKLMYSRGDKEILADARSQLTAGLIGLLFIVFAYVILSIIGADILKIPGFGY